MPNTRNQWVAYLAALNTNKSELHIKDMKSVVREGPKNRKYWNLQSVVMSECSLIATRNSHAKHKKSVGRIHRGVEICETGEGVSADTEGLTMKAQIMDERREKHSQILVFADCSIKTPNM